MSVTERAKQSSEVVAKKPVTKGDLRNVLDKKMQVDAKKLLENEAFRQKLSGENLEKFMKDHSKDEYTDYKKWNEDFLEKVLGLKDLTPVQQRIHILALQELLNKEKGGFTDEQGKDDSLDGKLGPFTLGKLTEYYNSIIRQPEPKAADKRPEANAPQNKPEQTSPQAKETAPGVISRLTEDEKFGKDQVFYAGDSIMVGIAGGGRVDSPQKSALISSHLVRTERFDTEKYRKNHIFVEEEAMKFLQNGKCKMLVINGGGNDLAARGRTDTVRKQIIETYKKIIRVAKEKGVKVTIYASNDEDEAKTKSHISIYKWLREESGADVVVDSTKIVAGRYGRDGIHPQASANRDLFKSLDFLKAAA